MTQFKISGVWKDDNNVITHYSLHTIKEKTITRASKTSKAEAIRLLENKDNSATTWVWNYSASNWADGENVTVVNGPNGKFLRSNPDKKETNNLEHLIDFDWIAP